MKKFVRKIIRNTKSYIFNLQQDLLYPNRENFAENLKNQIRNLEPINCEGKNEAEILWNKFRNSLREEILTKKTQDFLNFGVINYTMFHDAKKKEYDYLVNNKNKKVWKKILKEIPIGNAPPYKHDFFSSGNLIHTAYNLAQYMDGTGANVNDFDKIIEFGGGYGCMCRIIKQLGFKGQYIIIDLPEFSHLQEYYLKSSNQIHNVILLDDYNKLDNISYSTDEKVLFIGTWSLSETPMYIREAFLEKLNKFSPESYLIGYQSEFEGENNIKYFEQFKNDNSDIEWIEHKIEHIETNYYLFGLKRNFK